MRAFNVPSLCSLALLAGALLASVPANADVVYTSWTYDDDAGVAVNLGSTGVGGYVDAGEFTFKNGSSTIANTWCMDVYHYIAATGDFAETAPVQEGLTSSNILNGNGAALSWDILGQMGFLANYYDNHESDYYKSSVQIAIWDVEYGKTFAPVNGDSGTVTNQVASLISLIGTNRDWDFYWLNQAGNQGQLLMCGDAPGFTCKNGDNPPSVPEPASLALLGAGLLGLTAFGAVRRRRANRSENANASGAAV